MNPKEILNKKQILFMLLLLNLSCFSQSKNNLPLNVYPWYLESWVWVTAGLVLGALVVSALRGDIKVRR